MRENISKTDNNIMLAVLGIPFAFFIGYVLYSFFSGPSLIERIKMDDLSEHIHGKVDSLYIDVQNHHTKFAVINNNEKVAVYSNWERYIEVGDSISKNKN